MDDEKGVIVHVQKKKLSPSGDPQYLPAYKELLHRLKRDRTAQVLAAMGDRLDHVTRKVKLESPADNLNLR
jgi:hypothetical protein